ncbi:hypothetical protein BC833DRAFT_598303 [Globomyces pollinis-pini]|nr:hypothetical protein BC833DRAFT_598303 [Globomyces pollinis-pini]
MTAASSQKRIKPTRKKVKNDDHCIGYVPTQLELIMTNQSSPLVLDSSPRVNLNDLMASPNSTTTLNSMVSSSIGYGHEMSSLQSSPHFESPLIHHQWDDIQLGSSYAMESDLNHSIHSGLFENDLSFPTNVFPNQSQFQDFYPLNNQMMDEPEMHSNYQDSPDYYDSSLMMNYTSNQLPSFHHWNELNLQTSVSPGAYFDQREYRHHSNLEFIERGNVNDLGRIKDHSKVKKKSPKTSTRSINRNKHVGKACTHCKKAHLACDSSRPCKRCTHLGKSDCIDVTHKRRGRPPTVLKSNEALLTALGYCPLKMADVHLPTQYGYIAEAAE